MSKSGFVNILLVALIVGLAIILSGALFGPKQTPGTGGSFGSGYLCCDSGDGEACKTSETEKFTWKGTNVLPEEYALLKSNVALLERAGHIAPAPAPDDMSPDGGKIFLNTTNQTFPNGYDQNSGYDVTSCQGQNQDLIFKSSKQPFICQGIDNDAVIYVCKSGCEKGIGKGEFDVYYRTKDGDIPDAIKNCEKPEISGTPRSGQPTIVFEQQPGKQNLQLQTFEVIQNPGTVPWLSPFCKPAVYLYPEGTSYVSVRINSSEPLTYSDPVYPTQGWGVIAEPSGLINYQNKPYDYLYYETKVADNKIDKPTKGFVVEKSELANLFSEILPKLGLNVKETQQFSNYWLKVLPQSPYYFIGIIPQTTLNSLTSLNILPQPATEIRVSLYLEPLEQKISVDEPQIYTPKRTGFTVVEWGGIYKKYPNESFSCFL